MICPSCKAENDSAADACSQCGRNLPVLKLGEVLNRRYEILDVLGQGGMGAVYKAQDRILDEIVAVIGEDARASGGRLVDAAPERVVLEANWCTIQNVHRKVRYSFLE